MRMLWEATGSVIAHLSDEEMHRACLAFPKTSGPGSNIAWIASKAPRMSLGAGAPRGDQSWKF